MNTQIYLKLLIHISATGKKKQSGQTQNTPHCINSDELKYFKMTHHYYNPGNARLYFQDTEDCN